MKKPARTRDIFHFLDLLERAFPGAFFIGEWNDERGFDYSNSYVSPTIENLTGLPGGEFMVERGRFLALVHPEDRQRMLAVFEQMAHGSEKFEVTYRLRNAKTGEERWVLEHDASVAGSEPGTRHLLGVLLDITEQRRNEQALRAAEARMRMIVEGTPYLFFYTQDEEGRVTYVSPSVELITGYSVGEWLGQTHWFITDNELNLPARRASHAHLRGEPPHGPLVIEIVHKKGHTILLEVFEHPIVVNGSPAGIQGVARDVTDEHRLREELTEARKFEAIGRLASGIAHDFNNMLQGILLSAELAIGQEGEEAADRWATSVVQLARRGQKVVRQLLAFSQQQAFQAHPLDLARLLEENRPVIERIVGSEIGVRIDIPADLPLILADETQLLQVFLNLVDNARNAMPEGGKLEIVARQDAEPQSETGQRWVVLEFRDSGEGIDEEHLPLVFDPFFTTRMAEGGSGLGLASVKGIVTQHGGAITVFSKKGLGSVFRVRLPAAPSGALEGGGQSGLWERSELPEQLSGGPAAALEMVLLVEDHDEVRHALAQALKLEGYRVLSAPCVVDAERLLEENDIDVLLSDLQLPDGIGYDLAEPAWKKNPEMAIIFLSGFLGGLGPATGRSAPEGTVCLEKPIRFAVLNAAIREQLGRR